jgi:hypothetical protein
MYTEHDRTRLMNMSLKSLRGLVTKLGCKSWCADMNKETLIDTLIIMTSSGSSKEPKRNVNSKIVIVEDV